MTAQDKISMNRAERKERDALICAEYLAGETQKALGEKYNITKSGVCRILKRSGVRLDEKARRKRQADAVREKWKDPEFRKRQADAVRENWKDPEFRKRQADVMRENWKDPEFRKRQADATREANSIWPDCPPELREDYETLRRQMTSREARKALEGGAA